MKRPPLAHGTARRRGSRAKLCTWPPSSPPTLFPLPVSCYDFSPFGAGKRGIQAWKAPGTAASAKHREILDRVCVLAALPWLISCQRLPSQTQWRLKRSLSCVEQVHAAGGHRLPHHHERQQESLIVQHLNICIFRLRSKIPASDE